MKKSLIALALAGALSSPAFASTGNVDVYGTLDASVNSVHSGVAGTGRTMSVASTGSHVGFKGAEDLGNGMTAIWQIESGLSVDEGGASALTARDTFLGLKSHFGTIRAGTMATPMMELGRSVDVFASTMADSRNLLGAVGTGKNLFDLRTPNTVSFAAPTFMGVDLAAAYSTDTTGAATGADNTSNDAWSVAGHYTAGPMMLGMGFERHNSALAEAKLMRLVGGYDLFGVKTSALYEKSTGTTVADNRVAYGMFASYPMGAWTMKASFLHADNSKAGTADGASQWAVGADYALSKRTAVYGLYASTDNKVDAAYGLGTGARSSDQVSAIGADPSVLSVGLRHAF